MTVAEAIWQGPRHSGGCLAGVGLQRTLQPGGSWGQKEMEGMQLLLEIPSEVERLEG